jgi:CRP/FNR family cyclic AMP-dependent transcriptional regulator
MGLAPDSSQLLSRLPTHLATDLFASAKPVKLAADRILFLADDPGDSCYRVEYGLLKVTMVSRSGIERILSFIGRGGIVGELAILDGQPRSASVVAVRDTELSRLTRTEFDAFAERHPELYKSLITLTQRLRETNMSGRSWELPFVARSRCSLVARIGGSFRAEARIGPHHR